MSADRSYTIAVLRSLNSPSRDAADSLTEALCKCGNVAVAWPTAPGHDPGLPGTDVCGHALRARWQDAHHIILVRPFPRVSFSDWIQIARAPVVVYDPGSRWAGYKPLSLRFAWAATEKQVLRLIPVDPVGEAYAHMVLRQRSAWKRHDPRVRVLNDLLHSHITLRDKAAIVASMLGIAEPAIELQAEIARARMPYVDREVDRKMQESFRHPQNMEQTPKPARTKS